MIPHVIVLEPGLVIYKICMDYWFFGRPTVEDLRQDLRAVTKKCRPDWDITTPELRAGWQQGRKELFYPYGKTYAQPWANRTRIRDVGLSRFRKCGRPPYDQRTGTSQASAKSRRLENFAFQHTFRPLHTSDTRGSERTGPSGGCGDACDGSTTPGVIGFPGPKISVCPEALRPFEFCRQRLCASTGKTGNA